MSTSPSGTLAPSSSSTSDFRRAARSAPRRWIPTIAKPSGSAFFSTTSCAMRTRVRRTSSSSRTTFSGCSIPSFLASRDRVKGGRLSWLQASSACGGKSGGRPGGPRLQVYPPDEVGLALLGERDLDGVEVARDLGGREGLTRLLADLAPAVARRDVRQREQAHLRVARQRRRLARGRVPGLSRALGLLVGERRLVDEHVGLVGGDGELARRPGIARDDDLATSPLRADDLLGAHAVDRLALLQAAEIGPGRHPEPRRDLGVEAPRPRVLDDDVGQRRAAAGCV